MKGIYLIGFCNGGDMMVRLDKLDELIAECDDSEKILISRVLECISEIEDAELNRDFLINLIRDYVEVTEELEKKSEEVQQLQEFDELTMVYNKRKFEERLQYEIARKNRYDTPLSLVFLDLDGFKELNEIHGFSVGDRILSEIAGLIRAFLREIDIVARWIGETFIVLLPDTELGGAIVIAERLRLLVGNHEFEDIDKITASFGVTEYINDEDYYDFIERARVYLVEAKEIGRNHVVHH